MDLWERQPGETAKAFYAFTLYRDIGYERSITKVAQLYNAKKQLRALVGRWSSKNNWVERARAYDEHLDELGTKQQEENIRKMQKRHITLSMALQQKAAEKLKDLKPEDMRVLDAIKAIIEGAKLERLTRGEPTETVHAKIEPIVIKMWQPSKEEMSQNVSK